MLHFLPFHCLSIMAVWPNEVVFIVDWPIMFVRFVDWPIEIVICVCLSTCD